MTNTVQTFKSERAARIAFGKAERAWRAARSVRIDAYHKALEGGYSSEKMAEVEPFQAEEDRAWAKMSGIYNAAKEQGIYIHSYDLGYNPTRELIAANID